MISLVKTLNSKVLKKAILWPEMLSGHQMIQEKSYYQWPINTFNTILDFIRMARASIKGTRKINQMMMKTLCLVLSILTWTPKKALIKGCVEVKQWEASMTMVIMEQPLKPLQQKLAPILDYWCLKKHQRSNYYKDIINFSWTRRQLHHQWLQDWP